MPDELGQPTPSGDTGTTTYRPDREVIVVLVRHGESLWNAEGRYQGQLGPGLSDLGHDQAKRAADFLIATFGSFHRALASDLPRVQETLRPWSDATGVVPEIDRRWREIDAGAWSGRFPDEVRAEFPEELAAFQRGEDIPRGGGETFAQLRARAWEAMTDAATRPFDDLPDDEPARVVVFTHGGCINMTAADALEVPAMGHRWLKSPANCSASVFRHTVDSDGRLRASDLIDYNVDTSSAP